MKFNHCKQGVMHMKNPPRDSEYLWNAVQAYAASCVEVSYSGSLTPEEAKDVRREHSKLEKKTKTLVRSYSQPTRLTSGGTTPRGTAPRSKSC